MSIYTVCIVNEPCTQVFKREKCNVSDYAHQTKSSYFHPLPFQISLLIPDICNLLSVCLLWSSFKQRCCTAAGLNASLVPLHRWWHFPVNLPGERIVLPHSVHGGWKWLWCEAVVCSANWDFVPEQSPIHVSIFSCKDAMKWHYTPFFIEVFFYKRIKPSTCIWFLSLIVGKRIWHKA